MIMFVDWCIDNNKQSLLSEWDYDKNGDIKPENISYGSHQIVWWKCVKGHEWQDKPNHRTGRNSHCPFCSGRRALDGFNDLRTLYPDIAAEWHPSKNGNHKSSDFTAFSHQKVWWRCSLGHEWESTIANRTSNKNGCPFCSGKAVLNGYNDLATKYPYVAKEWDYEKNGDLRPSDISYGSNQKVWWKCSIGHEWFASVGHRASRNEKCPYCSNKRLLLGYNDLTTCFPSIAQEWHPTKNDGLSPSDVLFGSHRKVWWKCSAGHEWKTRIVDRTSNNHGCPYCSGNLVIVGINDLKTSYPEIAAEWHPSKNGNLMPSDVKAHSSKKVWWKCVKGHEWQAVISNRTGKGHGCPFCSGVGTSLPEQAIAYYLENISEIEQRNKTFGKEIDIYLPNYKIGIEYDGLYFHPSSGIEREKTKDQVLRERGLTIIRVKESNKNLIDGNTIFYKVDNLGLNFEWSLKQLFSLLYSLTNNDSFKNINVSIQRDLINIRERLSLYYKENSISVKRPELVNEWNYDKNGALTPEIMSYSANNRVWWKCSKGHEWQAMICSRAKGDGCPYCNHKRVIIGETDLLTLCQDVAKEWHPTKNGELTPSMVLSMSSKKVWWMCSKGHEWQAQISNRVGNKTGCPICAKKKVINIDLNKEFDTLKAAADFCGLKSISSVTRCCDGKTKTAGGYHWRYVE